jgi:hypothetical protein
VTRRVQLLVRAVFAEEEAVADAFAELAGLEGDPSASEPPDEARRWLRLVGAGLVAGLLLGAVAAVAASVLWPGVQRSAAMIDAGVAGAFVGVVVGTYLRGRRLYDQTRAPKAPMDDHSMIVATSTVDLEAAIHVIESFGGSAVEVMSLAGEEGTADPD